MSIKLSHSLDYKKLSEYNPFIREECGKIYVCGTICSYKMSLNLGKRCKIFYSTEDGFNKYINIRITKKSSIIINRMCEVCNVTIRKYASEISIGRVINSWLFRNPNGGKSVDVIRIVVDDFNCKLNECIVIPIIIIEDGIATEHMHLIKK